MVRPANPSDGSGATSVDPVAGVLVVWSGDAPRLITLRVPEGGIVLGRTTLAETGDDRLSRQHARIEWNGTRFHVTDLGSRNGTFVGGDLVADGEVTALPPTVVRTGRTISVLCADIQPYECSEETSAALETERGADLGATNGRAATTNGCPAARVAAATAKRLAAEVQAGRAHEVQRRAREPEEVHVPPLRDCLEVIPWLVAEVVCPVGLPAHPNLIEACLLRPWPGNVSEFVAEVARAAQVAVEAGRKAVRAEDLGGDAGRLIAVGESHNIGFTSSSRIRTILAGSEDNVSGDPLVTLRDSDPR